MHGSAVVVVVGVLISKNGQRRRRRGTPSHHQYFDRGGEESVSIHLGMPPMKYNNVKGRHLPCFQETTIQEQRSIP